MSRARHASPKRSWPTLLRHALRAHLATRGMTIPEGLVIRYREGVNGGPGSVDVRDDPLPTETATRFTHVARPVHDDGRASREFLEAAMRHVRQMRRARARLDALVAAGHDPRHPPMHAVEAHPLIVLAFALNERGEAGICGETGIQDGVMWARELVMTANDVPITIRTATTARISFAGEWPETLGAISGIALRDLLELPKAEREIVDRAMDALVVERSWLDRGRLVLELAPVDVLPIRDTPPGEDGRWKSMEPVPTA